MVHDGHKLTNGAQKLAYLYGLGWDAVAHSRPR
jgi:hypothetical protein